MKILVNTSNLNKGGALQVANSFLFEIKNLTDIEFHVVLSESLDKDIDKDAYSNNFKFYTYTLKPSILKAIFGKDKFLDSLINKINPEKVLSIFGPSYWITKKPHLIGYAIPHYIYGESPFFKKYPLADLIKLKFRKMIKIYNLRKKNHYFWVETYDVRKRLSELLTIDINKIRVMSNTFHPIFNDFTYKESILSKKPKLFTFLTVSAYYPHKNLDILNNIVPILRDKKVKCRFLLTIDNKSFEKFKDNQDYIENIGPLKIDQCPEIYSKSNALFLPTLLECFSASYPESMKMKLPILTSNLSFAKDICQDSALYFDPKNPRDIADKICFFLKNTELQSMLVKNGFERLKEFDTSKDRAVKIIKFLKDIA